MLPRSSTRSYADVVLHVILGFTQDAVQEILALTRRNKKDGS